MVDDAVDSLMSWTAGTADPTAAPDPGGHDAHQPDYPRGVLREAITNALMHRDYSPDAIGTPVQVNVFTDRIEISNPGGLFGSATKGTMSHKVSPSTRNQYMFNLLQSTPYPDGGSVIENGGTGYQQIEAGLKAEGGEPAIIDNTIQRFTITIPRRRAPNENGERNLAQRIMKLLESRPYASVRDIMTDLGLSPIAVATGLRVLKNKGLIESEPLPQRPQTVYRLVGSNS
jgi:ATP-dependent DNA helicase RecG